jgi:hypothetical protein
MATAAAIAKPDKALAERRRLAVELVTIHHKHRSDFARIDELKAALKKIAGDAGENFQEALEGKGVVKVSAPKDGKFKGIFPVIQEAAYLALPDARRNKLEEDGIVKMTPMTGNPFYGSVTVELF